MLGWAVAANPEGSCALSGLTQPPRQASVTVVGWLRQGVGHPVFFPSYATDVTGFGDTGEVATLLGCPRAQRPAEGKRQRFMVHVDCCPRPLKCRKATDSRLLKPCGPRNLWRMLQTNVSTVMTRKCCLQQVVLISLHVLAEDVQVIQVVEGIFRVASELVYLPLESIVHVSQPEQKTQ
jgi:hypothetical protein